MLAGFLLLGSNAVLVKVLFESITVQVVLSGFLTVALTVVRRKNLFGTVEHEYGRQSISCLFDFLLP